MNVSKRRHLNRNSEKPLSFVVHLFIHGVHIHNTFFAFLEIQTGELLTFIDFLKVVRLVFWSGVVDPELSLARATRSKARLVSKSTHFYCDVISWVPKNCLLTINL